MITKKVYRVRMILDKPVYKWCIVTKCFLFGFIPVYIKYEEII